MTSDERNAARSYPACGIGAIVPSPPQRRRVFEEEWIHVRGVAPLIIVLVAVMLTASSCGASDKPTKQLLRSNNPLTADLYVQIKGPAGAVSKIAHAIETGAFTTIKMGAVPPYGKGGSFVPPPVQSHRICLFAQTIQPVDSPQLQQWWGKKITFTVYGDKGSSMLYCRLFGGVGLGAH
jgi:hypothetical protein